ncbi:type II secretion system GspH family protein [Candidatus Gracilibacteria bacterium]|nr:type II secretion system GspH family protein [Candidatus Gracilibacteria bacterium]
MFSLHKKTSGFTLVELIIAMTIFGMMMAMVMTIYFSTTNTTRKLNAQREIAETAREIIERITEDIQEKGMTGDTMFDNGYNPWKTYNYLGSGSEYINLKNGRYVYGIKRAGGMDPCTGVLKTDPKIHCGLYFVEYSDNGANGYNLVDSINPIESRKRVKVSDLKFYVSGDGINTTRKVLLNFSLELMPRNGFSPEFVSATKLHIQTTISERSWKK